MFFKHVNGKCEFKKLLLLVIIFISGTLAVGDTVLERKNITEGRIDCSALGAVDIFFTGASNAFVLMNGHKRYDGDFYFYSNQTGLVVKNGYGKLLNGFVENDRVKLAFWSKDGKNIFYDPQDEFRSVNTIQVAVDKGFWHERVIGAEAINKSYMLTHRNKWHYHPLKMLGHILSGGHGDGSMYPKFYLTEIKESKPSKYKRIKFGNKRNQDYDIKATINDGSIINFLGFKLSRNPGNGYAKRNSNVILYYVGCDLKKKQVTQSHDIYTTIQSYDHCHYGPLSMSCKDNKVFVVFSLYETISSGNPFANEQTAASDIYFFLYSDDSASNTVKIAKGFMPLVKVDSHGSIYVFWADRFGNLVSKRKQDDTWSEEKVTLTGIDLRNENFYLSHIVAEFDSEDNLHLVYQSKGDLIYEKRTLSE